MNSPIDMDSLTADLNYNAARIEAARINEMIAGRLTGPDRLAWVGVLAKRLGADNPDFAYLEIGSLFGGSMMLAIWGARGGHFCGVDLFTWYGKQKEDPITKVELSRELATENVYSYLHQPHLDGAGPSECLMIRGDSQSQETKTAVMHFQPSYDLLLIDGDHSKEGCTADFCFYSHLIKPGGIVMIDDYGAQNRPGVTRAVAALHAPGFDFLGALEVDKSGIFVMQREGVSG